MELRAGMTRSAREAGEDGARGCRTGSGVEEGNETETPQQPFHPVTKTWETSPGRFTVVKRFYSLSSPFHANCYKMLIWHPIKCA